MSPLPTLFVPSTPVLSTSTPSLSRPLRPPVPRRHPHRLPRTARLPPSMIQSPNSDGPPDLEAYFDKSRRRTLGSTGPPIRFATSRALLSAHSNSVPAAAAAALDALFPPAAPPSPSLLHLTHTPDVPAAALQQALHARCPSASIIARTVTKPHASGLIELLLLEPGSRSALSLARATAGDAAQAARVAAGDALAGLGASDALTFFVFAHSPAPGADAAVRAGIDRASPGAVAYGGPAAAGDGGQPWTLFGGDGECALQTAEEAQGKVAVLVAAVSGSMPFIASAVVKSWAQPGYVEKMPFMQGE